MSSDSNVIAELTSEALARCEPDLAASRKARDAHPQLGNCFAVHVYCKEESALRARMFAPLAGTWEDPATGSANAPLACLLLAHFREVGWKFDRWLDLVFMQRIHV